MSDIGRDFKELPSVFDAGTSLDYIKGFQAGRAHDIEGLIAEIYQARDNGHSVYQSDDAWINAFEDVVSVIRKHFGEE